MKPFIGITCAWDEEKGRYFLAEAYVRAVEAGGGIPLPLAYTPDDYSVKRLTGIIGGLVLSGGTDVDPVFFGEDPIPGGGELCPHRDQFELSATRAALASGMPVLGICRGMQVLNIAAGGDIYQDIASQAGGGGVKHCQQAPRWHPTHDIVIREGTVLASILGAGRVRVNSFHHQAVRNVAPGFTVSAGSADGVAEAIEAPDHLFTVGVQCHPEAMWKEHPVFLALFERLARAAEKYTGNKVSGSRQ
ncbi:MAG: gamma-glutamyl-gamma-aminobutyrate hydrolase family protein [Bacillota bacterium]